MIYLITGRADSGKTTYARNLSDRFWKNDIPNVVLDGDIVRGKFPTGYSDEERYKHIMRIAKFASLLEDEGYIVIIAIVAPKKIWRDEARSMFSMSKVVYTPGGWLWKGTSYEEPDKTEQMIRKN